MSYRRPKDHTEALKIARDARKFLEALDLLTQKPPRAGVRPTKVIPDKTKYSRKTKHKKSL